MKIIIYTKTPVRLRNSIIKKTHNEELRTWELVRKNNHVYLTHMTGQFDYQAFLGFSIPERKDMLEVSFKSHDQNEEPADKIKGVYIGRFVEALLNHFEELFKHIIIVKD